MLYSEAFKKMGVPDVTRGSPWAAINKDGVLVIMGHEDYFDRDQNGWFYEHPAQPGLGALGGSVTRALNIIKSYYEVGKPVTVAIGKFVTNGGPDEDGKILPAVFKEASGDAYKGVLREFDFDSGHFIADCKQRFSL